MPAGVEAGDFINIKGLAEHIGVTPKTVRLWIDNGQLTVPISIGKSRGWWALKHGYLEEDPVADLGTFDGSPQSERRALDADERDALLEHCDDHRRLLYEMALFSGLRVKELRHLRPKHLNTERGGVKLEAEWTKGRRDNFQPLPDWLVDKLAGRVKQLEPDEPLI